MLRDDTRIKNVGFLFPSILHPCLYLFFTTSTSDETSICLEAGKSKNISWEGHGLSLLTGEQSELQLQCVRKAQGQRD